MFAVIRRLTTIGGVVAFARSPMGRQLIAKGRTYWQDPKTQERVAQLRSKLTPGR